MRIVVLGIRGFPDVQGGIERHCQELYPRLVERHLQVTVLARKGYVNQNLAEYKGVRIVPLWAARSKHFEAISHTIRGILWIARRRAKFDILHLHAIGPALLAPAARQLRLRMVFTHHGPDYNRKKWGRLAKKFLRLGEFLGTRQACKVIAVSKNIQQHLLEKYGSASVLYSKWCDAWKNDFTGCNSEKLLGLREENTSWPSVV